MKNQRFADTNILLRFFTGDPLDQTEKVRSLFLAVDSQEITLVILPLVVAETVYTLQSYYKIKSKEIAKKFIPFLQCRGIHLVEKKRILEAFRRYHDHNKVSFVDAYLAASATEEDIPILSFDRDFDRFKDVTRIEPK